MKHVVHIAPFLLVVTQVIDADGLPCPPVSIDQLLEDDGIALGHVHLPLVQPSRAVGRTRYRRADLAGEV